MTPTTTEQTTETDQEKPHTHAETLGSAIADQFHALIVRLFKREDYIPKLAAPKESRVAQILFWVGLAAFTLIHLFSLVWVNGQRSIPIEEDNAYAYIAKSVIMKTCWKQDCPALETLESTLTAPVQNQRARVFQFREYQRLYYHYHPLYSLIFIATNSLVQDQEQTYDLIELVFCLIFCLGLGFFLQTIFGSGPSGIVLLLFSTVFLVGQGIGDMVPGTMALALGFWLWTGMLRYRSFRPYLLLVGIPFLLLMHPIGLVYVFITLGIYLLTHPLPLKRSFILTVAGALGWVALFTIIPNLVSSPALEMNAVFSHRMTLQSYWQGVGQNFSIIIGLLSYMLPDGPLWKVITVLAFLLGMGVVFLQRRPLSFLLTLAVYIYYLISGLYVMLDYPGEMPNRAFVLFFFFGLSATASALWWALGSLSEKLRSSGGQGNPWWRSPSLYITLVTSLVLVLAALQCGLGNPGLFLQNLYYKAGQHNWSIRESQPHDLWQILEKDDLVLYGSETAMYYFLANGGLDYRTAFAPVFPAMYEGTLSLAASAYVTYNPSTTSPYYVGDGFLLIPRMEIQLDVPEPISQVVLHYAAPQDVEVEFSWVQDAEIQITQVTLPASTNGEYLLNLEEYRIMELILSPAGRLLVNGLSAGEGTRWPWGGSLTITPAGCSDAACMETIPYDTSAPAGILGSPLTVLSDEGCFVVLTTAE